MDLRLFSGIQLLSVKDETAYPQLWVQGVADLYSDDQIGRLNHISLFRLQAIQSTL